MSLHAGGLPSPVRPYEWFEIGSLGNGKRAYAELREDAKYDDWFAVKNAAADILDVLDAIGSACPPRTRVFYTSRGTPFVRRILGDAGVAAVTPRIRYLIDALAVKFPKAEFMFK